MNNFKRTSKLTDDVDDVVLASEVLATVEVELVSELLVRNATDQIETRPPCGANSISGILNGWLSEVSE